MTDIPRPQAIRASRVVEVITAACFIGLAVAGYQAVPSLVTGWRFVMPGTTDAALAPTFFPRLAMVLVGITAAGVMLSALLRREEIPLVTMSREDWRRFGTTLALIVAYVAGARVIGFLAASILFVAAVTVLSGYRNWLVIALASIVAPVAVLLVFRHALRVLLPSGMVF